MSIIHPAVEIVKQSIRLWDDDPQRAAMRAHLIVTRLIDEGYIEGVVKGAMAYQKLPSVADIQKQMAEAFPEKVDDGCGDGPLQTKQILKQFEHSKCPGCGKPILGAQTKTHMGQEWHLLCAIPHNEMAERLVPRQPADNRLDGLKKSSA